MYDADHCKNLMTNCNQQFAKKIAFIVVLFCFFFYTDISIRIFNLLNDDIDKDFERLLLIRNLDIASLSISAVLNDTHLYSRLTKPCVDPFFGSSWVLCVNKHATECKKVFLHKRGLIKVGRPPGLNHILDIHITKICQILVVRPDFWLF